MNEVNIIHEDIELLVVYDYTPGQKAIIDKAPEDCQEGFSPTVEIEEIFCQGIDIIEIISSLDLEIIESKCLEEHDGS